jgi:hypothetical protein
MIPTMLIVNRSRIAIVLGLLALPLTVSSCASGSPSHALGLHDTGITEGLPMPEYRDAWFGIPLNNSTNNTVEIESMRLTDATNLDVGPAFVVDIAHGDYIDWYAPPGTKQMQLEVARRVPLAGFTIPPHTHGRYEAVVLATARDRGAAASTTGGRIRYKTTGHDWDETWVERGNLFLSK